MPGRCPTRQPEAGRCPIYQTASYVFQSAEHAANLFALVDVGNIYARIMNVGIETIEDILADLDRGFEAAAGV